MIAQSQHCFPFITAELQMNSLIVQWDSLDIFNVQYMCVCVCIYIFFPPLKRVSHSLAYLPISPSEQVKIS